MLIGCGATQARSIDTVIFLDVDGVLNVGAYDDGEANDNKS